MNGLCLVVIQGEEHESLKPESRAQRAWRKADEADLRYVETLEEIKSHFGILLELRERKIAELEERLAQSTDERANFNVLVAEHSVVLRTALVAILQRKFQAFGAADGYAALEAMVARPDLILTGLDLPYVNGVELVRHVRCLAEDLPVLVMYRADEAALLGRIADLGVRSCFRKPFRLAAVVEAVEAAARTSVRRGAGSVFGVCVEAEERDALFRVLDARWRTLITASGRTALELASECPDVLIVDVGVSDCPWRDVVGAFRKVREDVKVVALCDPPEADEVRAEERLPINGFVVRPFSLDALLSQICPGVSG